LRKLKAEIVDIMERGSLPDYAISLQLPPAGTAARQRNERLQVVFKPKPDSASCG
jgi:hypothetical protein